MANRAAPTEAWVSSKMHQAWQTKLWILQSIKPSWEAICNTKRFHLPASPPEKSKIRPKALPLDNPAAKSKSTQISGTISSKIKVRIIHMSMQSFNDFMALTHPREATRSPIRVPNLFWPVLWDFQTTWRGCSALSWNPQEYICKYSSQLVVTGGLQGNER